MSDERDEKAMPASLPESSKETLSGRTLQPPEPYAHLAPDGLAATDDPMADATALDAARVMTLAAAT